jgi:hypothetical protein
LASIGLVEASKRARKKTPRSEVTGVEVTDIYVIGEVPAGGIIDCLSLVIEFIAD